MDNKQAHTGFNLRAVATFTVVLTSITLLASGVVMYFRPAWASLPGVYRGVWNDWHIALSLLFLAAAGIHLAYNWKALLRYLGAASGRARAQRKELAVAVIVFGCVTAAVFMQRLPFESLKGEHHEGPQRPAAAGMPVQRD